ncbi:MULTISPECIES: hypothetical protein [unclassified Paraflavitalea]|uniref:hypothetical protein n=1 Tax=unclassified Paraflavitalea TaxID=2798305 RepID=UPI003D359679
MFYIKKILALLFTIIFVECSAQTEEKAGKLSPKEFSIPPSPVFDLMGVTPSQINKTSDIKDFKVDWSFKSWRLNPNIAIQSQPFWELLYNRKSLKKYQQANPFMRKLASIDVSAGTVQTDENDRRIGFATKINLIKRKDPLLAKDLYADIDPQFDEEKKQLETDLKELKLKLDTTSNILEKPGLRDQIRQKQDALVTINSRRIAAINERAAIFISENWNSASLDFAFGRVYTYQSDSAGSLKKLRLNRNTGWGIWLNGGLPIGKRLMLSGLIRTTWYEEELNFLLRNINTGVEQEQAAVAENTIYSMGLNLRYGSPIYSFFVEFLYERKALKTPEEALKETFQEPANTQIVSNTVKWTVVNPNSLSFGGDWRVGKNVILNYGMRWILDSNLKSKAFVPIAGISCMMR